MDCIDCAKKIEKAVRGIDGVKSVRVSYALGKLNIEGEKGKLTHGEVSRTLERLGYKVRTDQEPELSAFFAWSNHRLVATIICGAFFVLGVVGEFILQEPYVYYPGYIAAILVIAFVMYRKKSEKK
jgi:Cd2+/Zn2+-exporting ATPase